MLGKKQRGRQAGEEGDWGSPQSVEEVFAASFGAQRGQRIFEENKYFGWAQAAETCQACELQCKAPTDWLTTSLRSHEPPRGAVLVLEDKYRWQPRSPHPGLAAEISGQALVLSF